MRRALLAALTAVGLALITGATAAPAGFRDSASLTVRAKLISGNAAAVVSCARSDAAWAAFLASVDPDAIPDNIGGFVLRGRSVAYLTRDTCRPLELRLKGTRVDPFDVGLSAYILTHESMHLRGIHDEGEADCRAIRVLPNVLRDRFGMKNATVRNRVLRYVRAQRPYLPYEYQAVC
jgi:hypothetical protein